MIADHNLLIFCFLLLYLMRLSGSPSSEFGNICSVRDVVSKCIPLMLIMIREHSEWSWSTGSKFNSNCSRRRRAWSKSNASQCVNSANSVESTSDSSRLIWSGKSSPRLSNSFWRLASWYIWYLKHSFVCWSSVHCLVVPALIWLGLKNKKNEWKKM